ncbi:sugar ABC transporter ATP-binding protein [Heyndrickxia acidicola]|uniref:Sugar ABC transporter ATP-binding protein n=2 Tax=Heyndrickxia acidicola TaxID=209389 RepID=A0ABU6MHN8_9BACI|nr:sugar ABC transporter ATP-binding protein [Heyndrickxia acidicola]MED1204191.1 sugar ABC transporter ATP-binding protein [Heyndrickxia acidicola]
MGVRLSNIQKSFGDNRVLRGISLNIEPGEVIALAGENGAGKSTLMKILSGALQPDSGQILVDETPVSFHTPQDAMAYNIRMIYQEMNLLRDLTVAENLFLVDETKKYGAFISNKRKMVEDAKVFLKEMGLEIDPKIPVAKLAVAEQQMVEISKSLVKEVKVLIMDEPTAALNKEETDRLFEQIRRLKQKGISIIYISHRMDEIFELSDRIVVLRDGQLVLEEAIEKVEQKQIVTSMVGKQLDNFYPKEHNVNSSQIRLKVEGLTKVPYFQSVSFDISKGEVLGVAGLLGSGKTELLKALFGELKLDDGSISIDGIRIKINSPIESIKQGIAYLTADRKQEGLIMDLSIYHNLSLSSLKQFSNPFGLVNRKKEQKAADEFIQRVNVKAASPNITVRRLSGGNQQKVVFGRWMMTQPKVFIMEEPTRGVDVGAKSEIYRTINFLTKQGISVLLVSSDIPELVAMSDRVVVLREGHLIQELSGDSITQHNILHYSLRGAVH